MFGHAGSGALLKVVDLVHNEEQDERSGEAHTFSLERDCFLEATVRWRWIPSVFWEHDTPTESLSFLDRFLRIDNHSLFIFGTSHALLIGSEPNFAFVFPLFPALFVMAFVVNVEESAMQHHLRIRASTDIFFVYYNYHKKKVFIIFILVLIIITLQGSTPQHRRGERQQHPKERR